jgi:hypothetical protein
MSQLFFASRIGEDFANWRKHFANVAGSARGYVLLNRNLLNFSDRFFDSRAQAGQRVLDEARSADGQYGTPIPLNAGKGRRQLRFPLPDGRSPFGTWLIPCRQLEEA